MSQTTQVNQKREVSILPPTQHTGLKLSKAKDKAAGVPGILAAFKHIQDEVGFFPGLLLLNRLNKKNGYDCPGCAWPDPDGHRSRLGEYCENGAKAMAEEGTRRRVDREFFKRYSVVELSRWGDYEIGKAGRVTEPFILRSGSLHYEPISWDDAFNLIGTELNALSSPDEALFYTSGRTSNEAAFLYQLFARMYGTNNMPDCSNMCHESSGVALGETLGLGKGSVKLEDLYIAELILVVGQNPGTNHPRMLAALKKCKDNGGQVVSINPLPEAGLNTFIDPQNPFEVVKGGTRLTDLHVPVRINGDVALLKGVMKILLEMDDKSPGSVVDHDFIRDRTEGYDAFVKDIRSADISDCVDNSGVPLPMMTKLAGMIASRKKIIACWAMGLTQHVNAVDNIREIVNLLLMKGAIGKPGAGTCPVRGHSNVQGDRTMGIVEKPKEAFLANLDRHYGFTSPRKHGADTVEAIHAMHEGHAKVFIGMGGNFISATPDSEFTGKAVQNCRLTVQISTKLNRSHLVTGDTALILPCLSRSEEDLQGKGAQKTNQFVTVENSMGVVHKSQGLRQPAAPDLKSEVAIVAGMALATLGTRYKSPDWEALCADYNLIREGIQAVIPGFDNFNQRVLRPEGFYLPNGPREGKFFSGTEKARFSVNRIARHELREGEYLMMTIRTHDQFNTTIYGLDDRYRGIRNERRVVLMNAADMKKAGIASKEMVDIVSEYEGTVREAKSFHALPYSIPVGCVATYFPEANVLVPIGLTAEKSNTPVSKSVRVRINKSR